MSIIANEFRITVNMKKCMVCTNRGCICSECRKNIPGSSKRIPPECKNYACFGPDFSVDCPMFKDRLEQTIKKAHISRDVEYENPWDSY